jgi:carboxypeptidase family protein
MQVLHRLRKDGDLMQGMYQKKMGQVMARSLTVSLMMVVLGSRLFAQLPTGNFQYVFPIFNSQTGSELILNNMSSTGMTVEVTLLNSSTNIFADGSVNVAAGSQQRLTAASFGLSSFSGSAVVTATRPLSVLATLGDSSGNFETVAPVSSGDVLIVPFGPDTDGSMAVTTFNPQSAASSVFLLVVAPDGSTLGSGQVVVPALGTISTGINALVSQTTSTPLNALSPHPGSTQQREISHVVVRTVSNVFGSSRAVTAMGTVNGFSDNAQGVVGPHFDTALVPGLPTSGGSMKAVFPLFVQGGDYSTLVQIINSTNVSTSASLMITGADGQPLSTSPAVVQIPANGSVRVGLSTLFSLPSGMQMGSLEVDSTTPLISSVALASVAQNGIFVMQPAEQANTNFAYRTRAADPQFFLGLAFRNTSATAANLTLVNIPDDGSGISSASWTIPPSALGSKSMSELLAPRSAGFVYVTSDVPLIAQALEGRVDDSMLAGLPAMHSQSDYQAPSVTVFAITGAVLHNGKPLAGATVQLTGPVTASTVTDASGTYRFGSTPAGQYSVRVVDTGYVISPTSASVTVTAGSQRVSDFNATLLVPFITVIQPSSVIAGSASTDLIIAGGPFLSTNQVIFDGTAFPGTLTQAGVPVTVLTSTGGISVVLQTQTVVKVTIPASMFATPRTVPVAVQNIGPGGSVTSSNQAFTISARSSTLSSSISDPLPRSILRQPAVEPSRGFSVRPD